MRILLVSILAVLSMICSPLIQAQQRPVAEPLATDKADARDREESDWKTLFDVDAPKPDRLASFEHLTALADRGSALVQFLVGAMFRSGMEHPTHLVPRDLDRAAIYLSNAAVNGQVDAMASMAELSLQQHKALDAMVWAQLFAHYDAANPATAAHEVGVKAKGYTAKLLLRCADAGRDTIEQATLNERLQSFVAEYDARIKQHREHGTGFPHAQTLEFDGAQVIRVSDYLKDSARADYVIGVDKSGLVKKVITIEAWPEARLADDIQPLLGRLRFKKLQDPAAQNLRWGILPMSFDYDGTPVIR